jgi:hypothetical protein
MIFARSWTDILRDASAARLIWIDGRTCLPFVGLIVLDIVTPLDRLDQPTPQDAIRIPHENLDVGIVLNPARTPDTAAPVWPNVVTPACIDPGRFPAPFVLGLDRSISVLKNRLVEDLVELSVDRYG